MHRLPNWLTWARLFAVPVVVVLMVADDGREGAARWWALVVFVVAAFTDFLDGYLARRWHVITRFGKLADPIADKALVLTTLLLVVIYDDLPWWPLAILAARELWVTVARLRVASTVVIAASRGGKLKTVLQLASVTFYLVPNGPAWLDAVAWWALLLAVVVAVATWVDYEIRFARARREAGGRPRWTSPPQDAVEALKSRSLTVACGESLTGGALCSALVSVPGASAAVLGAVVAYTEQEKVSVLSVDRELIVRNGVVSVAVARAMAEGARALFGADVGIGTTGAAGPDSHGGKPAGTVCLAVVGPDWSSDVEVVIPGSREEVRALAVDEALDLLLLALGETG